MAFTIWTYRRRFDIDGIAYEVSLGAATDALRTALRREGTVVARDETPNGGPEALRNHRLSDTLPTGEPLEVEAGYTGMWSVGIRVLRNGRLVHESHPGRAIEFPKALRGLTKEDPNYDPDALKRNRVPIGVDLALGAVFFLTGWFYDLTTAAIVGAVLGLALVVAQRFVKVDLLGGLALFGTLMLIASAALAFFMDSEMAVQLRTTILGTVSGTLFLLDGWTGGTRLGKGMSRYLAYNDVDVKRLAIGMGVMTLTLAALNLAVALSVSERLWLIYSTFLDLPLIFGGFLYVVHRARQPTSGA